mgnify:CR=1 FL=1
MVPVSKQAHFKFIFNQQTYFDNRYLRLFVSDPQGVNPAYAVIASKKLGSAVCRNRAKRQLKELLRRLSKDQRCLDKMMQYDCIWIIKRRFLGASFSLLQDSILNLMQRVR